MPPYPGDGKENGKDEDSLLKRFEFIKHNLKEMHERQKQQFEDIESSRKAYEEGAWTMLDLEPESLHSVQATHHETELVPDPDTLYMLYPRRVPNASIVELMNSEAIAAVSGENVFDVHRALEGHSDEFRKVKDYAREYSHVARPAYTGKKNAGNAPPQPQAPAAGPSHAPTGGAS